MKNFTRCFGLLIALLWLAVPASAQTTIDNTTLTAAVTTPSNTNPNAAGTITLAAVTCTGCTFGRDTLIYCDNEAMRVTGAYTSGLTVPVTRGSDGTRAAPHSISTVCFVGPGDRFHFSSQVLGGDPPPGICARANERFVPWINVSNGWVWTCSQLGSPNNATTVWRATVLQSVTFSSRYLSRLRSAVPDAVLARLDSIFRW